MILILNVMVFIFVNVIKRLAIESLFFNGHSQDFWHCLKAVTEKVVGCFDSKLENEIRLEMNSSIIEKHIAGIWIIDKGCFSHRM